MVNKSKLIRAQSWFISDVDHVLQKWFFPWPLNSRPNLATLLHIHLFLQHVCYPKFLILQIKILINHWSTYKLLILGIILFELLVEKHELLWRFQRALKHVEYVFLDCRATATLSSLKVSDYLADLHIKVCQQPYRRNMKIHSTNYSQSFSSDSTKGKVFCFAKNILGYFVLYLREDCGWITLPDCVGVGSKWQPNNWQTDKKMYDLDRNGRCHPGSINLFINIQITHFQFSDLKFPPTPHTIVNIHLQ